MKSYTVKIITIIVTSAMLIPGCSNPFRTKSRCELLCEQMHSECNLSCPADQSDPVCYSRCDNLKKCLESCEKSVFREIETGEEQDEKEGGDD